MPRTHQSQRPPLALASSSCVSCAWSGRPFCAGQQGVPSCRCTHPSAGGGRRGDGPSSGQSTCGSPLHPQPEHHVIVLLTQGTSDCISDSWARLSSSIGIVFTQLIENILKKFFLNNFVVTSGKKSYFWQQILMQRSNLLLF